MAPRASIRWSLPSPEQIVCSLDAKRQDGLTIHNLRHWNSDDDEVVLLRSQNVEMERQLQQSRERQRRLEAQVEEVKLRVVNTEKAEEMLCSQIGALEDEVKERARSYRLQLDALGVRLQEAQDALASARAELQEDDFPRTEPSHK